MELHEKLYQLRKKNGFTQAELAEKLNVSRQSVSNWELGSITPSAARLKALSRLYQVPWEFLLSEDEVLEPSAEKIPAEEPLLEKCDGTEKSFFTKDRKKWGIAMALCVFIIVAIAVIVFAVSSGTSREDEAVPLDGMSNGEISVDSGDSFDLEF